MKKHLVIPYFQNITVKTCLKAIAEQLEPLQKNDINQSPWDDNSDEVKASFVIAYTSESVLLKYKVIEDQLKAQHCNHNDPVCEDSCIEFFIAFENETTYYNLEANCLGAIKFAYGADRKNRTLINPQIINLIQTETRIKNIVINGSRKFCWQLTLNVPFSVFIHHQITNLRGKKAKANFYKCGDELLKPHYLVWNLIKADAPDFHKSQYFGELIFKRERINNSSEMI